MHLLYCDETNLEERSGVFFVYGGVSVSSESIESLSLGIDSIREKFGVQKDFRLKFNPCPPEIDHENFILLKQEIIELCVNHKCVLFTSFILHDIAKDPNTARRNEINRICYHFHCYLNRKSEPGIVLIDQFSDKKIDHHLREKFSVGLTDMPYSKEKRLTRIMGFHYSAIGQSNMCSVVDIILGSLRYAVNSHNKANANESSAEYKILNLLSPLFFRELEKDSISEIGLFFSPKVIKATKYREIYENLHRYLLSAGLVLEQKITDQRQY